MGESIFVLIFFAAIIPVEILAILIRKLVVKYNSLMAALLSVFIGFGLNGCTYNILTSTKKALQQWLGDSHYTNFTHYIGKHYYIYVWLLAPIFTLIVLTADKAFNSQYVKISRWKKTLCYLCFISTLQLSLVTAHRVIEETRIFTEYNAEHKVPSPFADIFQEYLTIHLAQNLLLLVTIFVTLKLYKNKAFYWQLISIPLLTIFIFYVPIWRSDLHR